MADPLSITLGAIAVTQVVYQFGCETYKIINDIRDAPDDVRRLVSGLEALCNVLQSLQAALGANKDSHPSELRAQMVWDIQEMVEKCMAIFGEIRGATSQWISEDGKQTKRRNFWKSRDVKQVRHQLDNRAREELTQQLNANGGQRYKPMNDEFQFDNHAYNLPMQRFLKRTESIFTARPRTSYEPSMIFSDGMSDHVWLGNDSPTEHNISASQRADLLRLPAVHKSKEGPIIYEDGEMRKENPLEPIVDVELARAESQHYWEWEKQKSTRSSS
ncbi:hypothetical protein LTS18_011133, partial [Coniosporium uncinatum]